MDIDDETPQVKKPWKHRPYVPLRVKRDKPEALFVGSWKPVEMRRVMKAVPVVAKERWVITKIGYMPRYADFHHLAGRLIKGAKIAYRYRAVHTSWDSKIIHAESEAELISKLKEVVGYEQESKGRQAISEPEQ